MGDDELAAIRAKRMAELQAMQVGFIIILSFYLSPLSGT